MLTAQQVERLRELGKKVREIAELPIQQRNKQLWKDVNGLRRPRPVLMVRDLQKHLLDYEDELKLTIDDPFWMAVEYDLLLRLYEWRHLRLDRVIEPTIKCSCLIHDTGFGVIPESSAGTAGGLMGKPVSGSKHYDPVIRTPEDLDLIKRPIVTYDREGTMGRFDAMREVFDGILDVKLFGKSRLKHALWDDIFTWMGIQEGMYNLALEPEMMHECARRYIEYAIDQCRQYEALGLLSSNNAYDNVGTNGIGYTDELPEPPESGIGAKLKDIWGGTTDQIFTSVSPAMTEEFAFDYEREYAKLFGLFAYGCCERLDHKLEELTAAFGGNLRQISMSPFSKWDVGLEYIGNHYVAVVKPNSNRLVGDEFDLNALKGELTHICDLTRKYGCSTIINMKTVISLSGDPTRLWKWCDLASDVIAHY